MAKDINAIWTVQALKHMKRVTPLMLYSYYFPFDACNPTWWTKIASPGCYFLFFTGLYFQGLNLDYTPKLFKAQLQGAKSVCPLTQKKKEKK